MYLKYTLIRSHTVDTKADESSLKLCMCANTIYTAASEEMTGNLEKSLPQV